MASGHRIWRRGIVERAPCDTKAIPFSGPNARHGEDFDVYVVVPNP
jgi:hypothetical protein